MKLNIQDEELWKKLLQESKMNDQSPQAYIIRVLEFHLSHSEMDF